MLKINTFRKHFWKIIFIAIFIFFAIPSATSASTIFRAPSVDGLVGYWDLNDGVGSAVAKDKSGQGHNGTLTNMDPSTDWVDGKVGSGALDFDGSDDYVVAGPMSTVRSVSVWFKHDSPFKVSSRQFYWNGFTAYVDSAGGLTAYYSGYGVGAYYAGPLIVDTWYHLVLTYDGSNSTAKSYLNGSEIRSAGSIPVNDSSSYFYIGQYLSATQIWDGLIDEVRIYNRALSASEITNLYNSQKKSFPTISKPSLSDGLVGYWNFDMGAGENIAYDMSGSTSTHNGTLTNMDPATDWVDGKIGSGALDFDGSNDYVQVDATGFPTGASPRTVGLWLKRHVASNFIAGEHPFKYGTSANYQDFGMYGNIGTTDLYFRGNSYDFDTGINLDDTNWHHITVTFDGTFLKAYKDSILISTTDRSLLNTVLNSSGFRFGRSEAGGEFWNGVIDEVRVYNRALSADEIQRLYKTTAGTKISKLPFLPKGLVGYWDLNDGAGSSVVKDKSRQEHNGTLTNMDPATDWVDGKVGSGALDFDGVNDYVNIVNNSLFENMVGNANVNKTLAIWFNADTLVAESSAWLHPCLMNKGNVYMNFGVDNSGEIVFYWYDQATVIQRLLTSGAGISTGLWYHAAVVLSEGTATLYVNGVNKGSGSFNGIHTGATGGLEWFGTTGGVQNTQRWDGKMDEARVYNRALSAEEIQLLYDLGNLKP